MKVEQQLVLRTISIILLSTGYTTAPKQESIPVGCVPSAAVAVGGVSACPGGVCPVHAGIHPPKWTEFLTHACENITFPQLLLRTVIICVTILVSQTKILPASVASTRCQYQRGGVWGPAFGGGLPLPCQEKHL